MKLLTKVLVSVSLILVMVLANALAQPMEDVSVAIKHKKKVTLVAVKNNGDEAIYGLKISFEDGIKFVKVRGWDRNRIDANTIIVRTNEKPIESGSTLTYDKRL